MTDPHARTESPPTPRAPTPSIRRGTSCSRRRPAPARRACWSSATSTCCAPASIRITSSRSRSRARPRPRCAQRIIDRLREASRLLAARRGALARSQGSARRHRHLDHRRVLPVAAARVPARGRRRSRLRPRGRHRGAAARRRIARSGAPHLPAPSRATTTTWRWCSRSSASGGCARGWRRCSTGGSSRRRRCGGICEQGPRDLTAAVACRRAAERLARRARRRAAAGSTRSSPTVRCGHPQFAMLAADIERPDASERRVAALDSARRPGGVPRAHRSAARLLPDAGRRAAREGLRRAPASRPPTATPTDAWKRHRAGGRGPRAARSPRRIRAFRRDLNVVMSRGVWRIFAVALAPVPAARSTRTRCSISPGVLERAVDAAEGHGRVRARAASGSRRAIATCSSTSSRTRAARSGSSCRSSCGAGARGFGAAADALPPSIFIVGDRKQSIYGFRDADVAVLDEAAAFIEGAAAGRPDPRQAITVSFRAVPALLAFVNDVFGAIDEGDRTGRRVPLRRARSVSGRARVGRADTAYGLTHGGRAGRRAAARSHRRRDREAAAERVADEIVRLLSDGDRARPRDRRAPRRRSRRDIAILFRSRDSHREFETALERRGVSDLRLQGARLLRRRRNAGRGGAAALSGRSDVRSARRGVAAVARSCGCRTRRLRSLAPATRRGADRSAIRRPRSAGLGDEDRARARAASRGACRAGSPWVDRMTPAELLDARAARDGVRVRDCAARGGCRRART